MAVEIRLAKVLPPYVLNSLFHAMPDNCYIDLNPNTEEIYDYDLAIIKGDNALLLRFFSPALYVPCSYAEGEKRETFGCEFFHHAITSWSKDEFADIDMGEICTSDDDDVVTVIEDKSPIKFALKLEAEIEKIIDQYL